MLRLCRFLFAVLLSCFLTGCGSPWATVDGAATLDEMPLDKGNVVFLPIADGPAAYGAITAGKFTLSTGDREGLKPGDYIATVTIQTIPEVGKGQAAKLLTPAKYATREKSDLRATIHAGKNDVKLKMTSK